MRWLRLFLVLGAITWGVAGVGIFLPWPQAATILEGFGAGPIRYDPMLDYWLRMASGAFALIGMLFGAAAAWPGPMRALLPWLAALMTVEGSILALHGLRLGLPAFPFYGDVAACFVVGFGILRYQRHAK
ncbi:MAG: hypothetical protein AB7O66_02455 [Limisphaerales bacterium]